jgi:predicted NBD/HSP70 family sugar kinase
MSELLFGIDLGGSKIEGIIFDFKTNSVHFRERISTEADKGYSHILNRIKTLVDMMSASVKVKPACIGFGTPGKWNPQTKCMQNSNTVCLNGKPLKTDLEKLLNIQVFISNDANCFALAESLLSDVAKFKPEVVFGIIMGTGVGGGIVVQDEVLNGLHGIAGEWGHNFLDRSGGTCYCGKVGCVETIISGTALEKFFYEKSGFQRKLPEIVELADNNDANAQETLNRLHYFFGKAIAHVINILDPDVVIVGGGVGNIDTIYTHGVKSINQFLFNNRLETKIVKPSLGDSAGVYGAALLCKRFG